MRATLHRVPVTVPLLKEPITTSIVFVMIETDKGIAGHGLTPFLAAAEAAGCRTANGGQMVEAVQELMVDFMIGPRTG